MRALLREALGLALTGAGLGGLGWLRARSLSGRCRDLEDLRQALVAVQAAIAHARLPARQALERAGRSARGTVGEACRLAARWLEEGADGAAGEVWMAALRRVGDRSFLAGDEMAVVEELCWHFGRVDAATQEALLRDAIARLDLVAARAQEERDRLERLYRFSGLAAGLALGLMLL